MAVCAAGFVAASLSMIGSAAPASAAGNGLWAVSPLNAGQSNRAYFNYLVAPGSVIHDSVFVSNSTATRQSFLLYPSDAVNTPTGGFSLKSPQASRKTVGKWTSLNDTQFSIDPHSVSDVPFTVTVPTNAPPGDYAGGIKSHDRSIQRKRSVGISRSPCINRWGPGFTSE